MSEFNWTCPYCQFEQTITEPKAFEHQFRIDVGETPNGTFGGQVFAIGCSNIK